MIEAQDDPKNKRHVAASAFGMFPRMAMAALGANLSASFPERINSAGKLILTPGRSGLPDLCLERCVILRINKKFIYHMKEKWPRQPGTGRLVMTAAQQKIQIFWQLQLKLRSIAKKGIRSLRPLRRGAA